MKKGKTNADLGEENVTNHPYTSMGTVAKQSNVSNSSLTELSKIFKSINTPIIFIKNCKMMFLRKE